MLGAIIGDLAGSIYEYGQTKKVKPKVEVKNLIEKNAFFSDDTILTVAIADAILTKSDYAEKLKEYGKKYIDFLPNFNPYFKTIFSPGFTTWLNGNFVGTSEGNGAMMRISAVGNLFETENAKLATLPSHNSKSAIKCATLVALIIFYARKGLNKDEIKKKFKVKFKKPNMTKFNYTCSDTIDVCLYSLFNSSSFEESLRLAISFGGDTDTNACIVGSMAEAMYGIDEELKKKALSFLPKEFVKVIKKYEKQIKANKKD